VVPADKGLNVEVVSDRPIKPCIREVTDPPSVVIDLRNVLLKTDQTRIPVTSRSVIELRVIQYQGT